MGRFVLTILAVLLPIVALAGWTNSPVEINPDPGVINVHSDSGNKRIVRVGSTVIVIVPDTSAADHTYRSTDGGANWQEIDTDGTFSGVLITGKGNYVYHFYHDESLAAIRMIKFLYDGTPGAPTSIITGLGSVNVGAYKMMSATVDSAGKLYVAYCHDGGGTGDDCYVSGSSDEGANWSAPVAIIANTANNFYIKIEADQSNNLLTTWKEYSAGPVYFSKSTDGGANWSTPTQLADASSKSNLEILPASSTTYYVFAQSEVSPYGLVFRKSTDGGANWSDWASIETTISTSGYGDPSAALGSDGTVYVAYRSDHNTSTGEWREHLARSTDGGSTWEVVYDYDEAEERMGGRSHLRYQTWFNHGGALDWTWMQYTDSGTNYPILFNTNADVTIAQAEAVVSGLLSGGTCCGCTLYR